MVNISFKKFISIFWKGLFFFMLFAPRTFQVIKIPLVIITVGIILIQIIIRDVYINKGVLYWIIIFLIFGLVWSLIAIFNNNPGAFDAFRIHVIWVLLYSVFVVGINKTIFDSLIRIIIISTVALSLYNIISLLHIMGYWPNLLYYELDLGSRIGIHSGYTQFTAHNIGTLAFTFPFILTWFINNKKSDFLGFKKSSIFLSMVISSIMVVLSGRRILLVIVALLPFIIIFIVRLMNKELRSFVYKKILKALPYAIITFLLIGISLQVHFNWNYEDYKQRVVSSFTKSTQTERTTQFKALMEGFYDKPFIGTGFGQGVEGSVRSDTKPWSYELTYVLYLYNTGIIGFIYFVLCLLWIIYELIKISSYEKDNENLALPLLVGYISFLLATASNPYLGSYDFMWIIFLPLSYINIHRKGMLLSKKSITI